MRKALGLIAALAALALATQALAQATATPGKPLGMVLVPKWISTERVGKLFDEVHDGAKQAAKELQNPTPLQFEGPVPGNSVAGQIDIVTKATAAGVAAIMITNNAGEQIVPALKAAQRKGIKIVNWDTPVPGAEGVDVYVAQVDFASTGRVLADMALGILGPQGGEFAILSTTPTAASQNAWIKGLGEALKEPKYASLKQVDLVYGKGEPGPAYEQALALIDRHPDLKLIVDPDSVGVAAAAKAMQDKNLCGRVKVTGLGLPNEMRGYVLGGCAPQVALWSFVDLGYLTYYTAYMLATGAIKAEEGQQFIAGRMGRYTIDRNPNGHGLRVVMGPFLVYDQSNIGAAE